MVDFTKLNEESKRIESALKEQDPDLVNQTKENAYDLALSLCPEDRDNEGDVTEEKVLTRGKKT